ncbi:hypothetical protein [Streptomyces sp. NRRL F-4474]|uniref:hypothetical protein n=1 Tax=Streptomyces sp. NRRL F-4474 TaxID=1463851 RepID=UPI0004C6EB8C|nr:hypothetical protein [Streptomyces sp. NRRL F-4474]
MSGGPFLRNFDGKRGDVIGVIGGWKTGGTIDDESYSSQFDADILRLYNQAVHDYEEITLAAPDSVFKYARGFATGKYGGNQWPDDLIVAPSPCRAPDGLLYGALKVTRSAGQGG